MSTVEATVGASSGSPAARWLREAEPAVLFGLRLWASVCLALYVAFTLELSEPSWAATTAALVCQPLLGASLRKASYRMIGTVVGAVAVVILAAFLRQDRWGFLTALALWCAVCAFVATLLRNFAAYGAALSGYTAAILASDILGSVGVTSGSVTVFAINRAIEICLGIVCAGVVLTVTDLGHSRRALAAEFVSLSSAIAAGFADCFLTDGPGQVAARPYRRDLLRRVIALDPMIDAAIGEASDLRYRSSVLQRAVVGFIATASAWRRAALEIEHSPGSGTNDGPVVHEELPVDRLSPRASAWAQDPAGLRRACRAAARRLIGLDAQTPTRRLMADSAALGMLGMARALNGLTLILDPRRAVGERGTARLHVPDWAPAFINAVRSFATIMLLSLFWIESAWPSGALAITFGAVIAVLLPLQGDLAYSASMTFLRGCLISTVIAVIFEFGLLPQIVSFPALCLALGLVLVPAGVFIALPWQPTLFFAASVNFLPMISLKNTLAYDPVAFWNSNIAILVGIAVATIAMKILPPLAPAIRTRRLLALTLADLRRLATLRSPGRREAWERRSVARLLAVPAQAEPVERAALASAISVGVEIIRLRRVAPRFVSQTTVDTAMKAFAGGRSREAIGRLREMEQQVAAAPAPRSCGRVQLSLRASILALSAELDEFASYYDDGSAR